MACYVLWIPSLEPSLVLRKSKIENYNIADEGITVIDAEINPETYQITITYQYRGTDQRILLSPFKPCQGCFLYYSLDSRTEAESTLARTLDVKFHAGLYHAIKCFYHQHTHHAPEEDSILHARFFSDENEYFAANQSDANYYIEEYFTKFSILNNHIDDCLEQIAEKENTEWKKVVYYLPIYSAYKRLIETLCRYEGEYLYYQSLRQSVSNILKNASEYDKKVASIDKEIRIKWRRIESAFNHTSSIIGTNISTVGLIVGVIGIILSVVATCRDNSEARLGTVQDELYLIHQEVKNIQHSQEKLFQSIDGNQVTMDSIANGMIRVGTVIKDLELQQKELSRQVLQRLRR